LALNKSAENTAVSWNIFRSTVVHDVLQVVSLQIFGQDSFSHRAEHLEIFLAEIFLAYEYECGVQGVGQ
jgi:hypothetical protein